MRKASDQRRIRVVIVDDHPMVREGTRTCLEQAGDIEVVAMTGSGTEACRLITNLRPDVLLLDLRLPDISGVEVAHRTRAEYPEMRILVVTGFDDVGYVRPLLKLGVHGYLQKTAPCATVVAAIRAIMEGKVVIEADTSNGVPDEGFASFTTGELRVLWLLLKGKRNAEIASTLNRSEKTVEYHPSHVLAKLGVRSRAEAIAKARDLDFVILDPPSRSGG